MNKLQCIKIQYVVRTISHFYIDPIQLDSNLTTTKAYLHNQISQLYSGPRQITAILVWNIIIAENNL